jgi:hypothetical protein
MIETALLQDFRDGIPPLGSFTPPLCNGEVQRGAVPAPQELGQIRGRKLQRRCVQSHIRAPNSSLEEGRATAPESTRTGADSTIVSLASQFRYPGICPFLHLRDMRKRRSPRRLIALREKYRVRLSGRRFPLLVSFEVQIVNDPWRESGP